MLAAIGRARQCPSSKYCPYYKGRNNITKSEKRCIIVCCTFNFIEMTDFSQYQGPVPEWEELVRTVGAPQPPSPEILPEALRSATNETRIRAAQSSIKSLGKLRAPDPEKREALLM